MCTVLLRTLRLPKTMPLDKFKLKIVRQTIEWGFPRVINCDLDDAGLRREVMSYYKYMEERRGKLTPAQLKLQTALVWNIQEETISAWKAHYTRGTYKDEE